MEPEIKAIQEAVASVNDSNTKIAALLEEQKAEIRKNGVSSEETAKKIEAVEKTWAQSQADQKGLVDRVEIMEKALQKSRGLGFSAPNGEQAKSLGALFADLIEKHRDEFTAAFTRKSVNGLPVAESKSIWSPENMGQEQKALSSTETTNFIPPYQLPGIIPMVRRSLRLRDLMNVVNTTAPAIRYIRQIGMSPADASALTVSSITRSGQVATVTTSTAHGYLTRDRVAISGADQTEYNGNFSITKLTATTFSVVVTGSPASGTGTMKVVRLNNFGAADFVAEGSAKPEAKFRYEEVEQFIRVVAHWIPATRQVLDDLPGLRNQIDNDLVYGLRRKEDVALLYGNGSSPQIQGIVGLAGTQTYSWSNGLPYDTMIDAIRRASTITQIVEQADPTGVVMHPTDWEYIETVKSSTNEYILVNSPLPGTDPQAARIWRIPVVVTPAILQGTAVQGPWGSAAALYDREQANVRFSDQHSDYFTSNMVAILAEERIAAAWYRPEAFVTITFDQAPAIP